MYDALRPRRIIINRGEIYFDDFRSPYTGPVNRDGEPVQRPKTSHPYNFDPFVVRRCGPNSQINASEWVDRMWQWDYERMKRLCAEHMPGHRWDNAPATMIEALLRAWTNDPTARLIVVEEHCNTATQAPTWLLCYHSGKLAAKRRTRKKS